MNEKELEKFVRNFNWFDDLYILGYAWNLSSHDYGNGSVLSSVEAHALQFIVDHPLSIVTDVSNYFALTLSAASKIVTRLVNKGLVEKKSQSGNRKNVCLEATSLGMEMNLAHRSYDDNYYMFYLQELRKKYGDDELEKFFEILKSYLDLLHLHVNENPR